MRKVNRVLKKNAMSYPRQPNIPKGKWLHYLILPSAKENAQATDSTFFGHLYKINNITRGYSLYFTKR